MHRNILAYQYISFQLYSLLVQVSLWIYQTDTTFMYYHFLVEWRWGVSHPNITASSFHTGVFRCLRLKPTQWSSLYLCYFHWCYGILTLIDRHMHVYMHTQTVSHTHKHTHHNTAIQILPLETNHYFTSWFIAYKYSTYTSDFETVPLLTIVCWH